MKVKFHRMEDDKETIEMTIRKRTWVRISPDYIIIDKRGIRCLNDSWAFFGFNYCSVGAQRENVEELYLRLERRL
jgi:hypothetical protein